MSPASRRTSASTLRRLLTVGVALAAVALVAVGGTAIRPEAAPFKTSQAPLVGRTTTVCTTSPAADATATISAVAAISKLSGTVSSAISRAMSSSRM